MLEKIHRIGPPILLYMIFVLDLLPPKGDIGAQRNFKTKSRGQIKPNVFVFVFYLFGNPSGLIVTETPLSQSGKNFGHKHC